MKPRNFRVLARPMDRNLTATQRNQGLGETMRAKFGDQDVTKRAKVGDDVHVSKPRVRWRHPSRKPDPIKVAALPARARTSSSSVLCTCRGSPRTSGSRSIRGRRKALAYLEESSPIGPPLGYELRDGQVYRWVEQRGRR
jgi:hypothetical protein